MTLVASPEPLRDRRFALLLAVSQYVDPTLSRLRAPAADAVALRDLLADPEIGGFAVTSVFDEKAQAMRLAVEGFLADRSPDDIVLVYLSCHGLMDLRRRLYFAARDTLKSRLASSGVEAHWLLDQLDDCRARRQVVILDCCFSGAFAHGAKGDTDLGLGERLMGQGRGRVVLTASRGTEYSFEGEAVEDAAPQGSVFTSALVRGIIDGEADADADGYITVDDAYSYAFEQVRNAGAQQTPQRWLYGAEGSIVLARRPVAIGSTTYVEHRPPETPEPPAAVPAAGQSSALASPVGGGVVGAPAPAPPGRSRRWLVGAAAVVLVAGAAAIGAWVLRDGDEGRDGQNPGGGDTANQLEVTAPWRLVVRDKISGEDVGCNVTVTGQEGGDPVILESLYGDYSFQMNMTGTVTWEANDPGCLVFQQPGAGELTLPFAHKCCRGDTDGFGAGDQVVVEIVDWNGNSSCDIDLHAVSDGRTLSFGTLEEGAATLTLDTFGESPVYVADHTCGLRVSSPG